jgi:hypothetical protein
VVKIGISTPRPKKLAAFFMRRELTAKDAKSAKKYRDKGVFSINAWN